MKTFLLLFSTILGVLFPFAHSYSFLIQYCLMLMLVFTFLNLSLHHSIIKKQHFYILGANILIPFVFYFLLIKINSALALAAFVTGISPTATSAPAVVYLLKGKVDFVSFSVLLTSFALALIMPLVLPYLIASNVSISFTSILFPVLMVLGVPLILAQLIKKFCTRLFEFLNSKKDIPFYILTFSVYLASAKSAHFIREEYSGPVQIIYYIAILSAIICALNFWLGGILGGKEYKQEGMQALGQKNNSLNMWIALTFINPLTAMGPVFYIIYHNIFNSFQLYNKRSK